MVGRFVSMRIKRERRKKALSLVEALAASMILAITVMAVASALMAGAQESYEALHTRRAAELAEALMEEIIALPYCDPEDGDCTLSLGPEGGETDRTLFDNVDDFHNYAEAAGAVVDAAGTAYPAEYARYARSVSIAQASLQPAGFAAAVAGVTVTVTVDLDGRTLATTQRFVAAPAS
jgi:MSHA pilin protein MshD